MALEFWQIAEARKALDEFCSQHQLVVDEEAARRASDYLLGATTKGIENSQDLASELRRHAFISETDARSED
jgi:hypothetical protein